MIREDKRHPDIDEPDSTLALQVQVRKFKKRKSENPMKIREERQREIDELEKKTRCDACKEFRHWHREYPKKNSGSEDRWKNHYREAYIGEVSPW